VPATLLVNWIDQPGGSQPEALSYRTLGQAYGKRGDLEQAIDSYRRSLEHEPESLSVRYNLALSLLEMGHTEEAIDHFRRAADTRPRLKRGETEALVASAHDSLAVALMKVDHPEEAVEHFRKAIELNPGESRTHEKLAVVLQKLGRGQEAIPQLQALLRADPGDDRRRFELSELLVGQGRYTDAIEVLRPGVERGQPVLLNSLAWLLATCPDPDLRDGAEALRLARLACPGDSCHPAILDTLAAALAEAGQLADAAATAERALDVLEAGAPERVEIAERLALYQADRPYRQPREPRE